MKIQTKFKKLFSLLTLIGLVLLQAENGASAKLLETESKTRIADVGVVATAVNKRCNVFILSIALGKHANSDVPPLENCAADARDLSSELKKIAAREYQEVFVETVIDEQATKANILSSFEKVAQQARPQDIFMLQVSGNGVWSSGNFYCLPYDYELERTTQAGHFNKNDSLDASRERNTPTLTRAMTLLSAVELASCCQKIKAERQLVLLDTCESADAIPFLVHNSQKPVVFGIQGVEMEGKNHGMLTELVLNSLQGQADLDRNGLITVRELRDCLSSEYQKEIIAKRNTESSLIAASLVSNNFVIGSLDSVKREVGDIKLPESTRNASKGNNYALLVATSNYNDDSFQQLKNPVTDATAIGKELTTKYDFKVELMENPSRQALLLKIKELETKSYEPADQLLLYFAGHGTWDGKEGYLVLRDSRSKDELYDSYVSLELLKAKIDRGNCKHVLVAMDSCYGGTFLTDIATIGFKQLRGSSIMDARPLKEIQAEIEPLTTRKFIAAGGKKPVYDGTNHSPLAERLLNVFRQQGGEKRYINFADIESSMQLVQPQGLARAFGTDDLSSDFLLVPKKSESDSGKEESSLYDADDFAYVHSTVDLTGKPKL